MAREDMNESRSATVDQQSPDEQQSYLLTQEHDFLARMNFELLSELWIVRDRLAVLEQILTDMGLVGADSIDRFVPDPGFSERLERMRNVVVENVLGAPFKNLHTVETLREQGRDMMASRIAPDGGNIR